jgi:archaellum component FlaC
MKATPGVVVVLVALLASAVLGATPRRPQVPAPALPAALPADQAAAPVLMVELDFADGSRVTGRLAAEDADTISVTALDGSTTAYRRASVKQVQRYTIPAADYAEQAGDYLARRFWRAENPPDTYVQAREQYEAALTLNEAAKDHRRLVEKLEALEKDRQAWQTEMVRRAEVKNAQDQAELTRLESEVARQRLTTLKDHEQRLQQQEAQIRQMNTTLTALQQQADAADTAVNGLDSNVTQLSQAVDTLDQQAQSFVTQATFNELRSFCDNLATDVQRLQGALNSP